MLPAEWPEELFSPLFLVLTIKQIYAQNKVLREDASGFSVSEKDSAFAT